MHQEDIAGYGAEHLHKEFRDNVGKGHLPAGIGNNLQRSIHQEPNPQSKERSWSLLAYGCARLVSIQTISLTGSGEGPGWVTAPGYSTTLRVQNVVRRSSVAPTSSIR